MVMKALRSFEKGVGLPKLSDAAQILRDIPDEAKLKQVKAIIGEIGKLKNTPEELAMALALIKYIVEVDMEHLNAVKDITGNLVKLIRLLPRDALSKLPVDEILSEIKKPWK